MSAQSRMAQVRRWKRRLERRQRSMFFAPKGWKLVDKPAPIRIPIGAYFMIEPR